MTENTEAQTVETSEEDKQEGVVPQEDLVANAPMQAPPMKSGYVIGIGQDDNFIFEILGTEPSVVNLLGLHKLAGDRINARVDFQLGGEMATVLAKLDSIIGIITGAPAAPGGNNLS